jgi:hypothetical protein
MEATASPNRLESQLAQAQRDHGDLNKAERAAISLLRAQLHSRYGVLLFQRSTADNLATAELVEHESKSQCPRSRNTVDEDKEQQATVPCHIGSLMHSTQPACHRRAEGLDIPVVV